MIKGKVLICLGIAFFTVLTGCSASNIVNERETTTADSVEVSLSKNQIYDSDQNKDAINRDYIKGQIEKNILSVDGIFDCSVDITVDDNDIVKAVNLKYTYDKDIFSGPSLEDLEDSFEKYIKGSFETVETININGVEADSGFIDLTHWGGAANRFIKATI